jgi:hypothetical protein
VCASTCGFSKYCFIIDVNANQNADQLPTWHLVFFKKCKPLFVIFSVTDLKKLGQLFYKMSCFLNLFLSLGLTCFSDTAICYELEVRSVGFVRFRLMIFLRI